MTPPDHIPAQLRALLDLSALLRSLGQPHPFAETTRIGRHLLVADLHDVWRFCHDNPTKFRAVTAQTPIEAALARR